MLPTSVKPCHRLSGGGCCGAASLDFADSTTHAAIWARELNPSFVRRCSTCPCAVRGEITKPRCDLLVGQSFGDQSGDLTLALGRRGRGLAAEVEGVRNLLAQGIGDRSLESELVPFLGVPRRMPA